MSGTTRLNSQNIINNHVADEIFRFIAKNSNFLEISALQDKYVSLLNEYSNTPGLVILSTISMGRLPAFNEWANEALQDYRVVPFLVSRMVQGDIFALSMYESLYKKTLEAEDSLITYTKIITDQHLKSTFGCYGGDESARAVLTAEHWLESSAAAGVFQSTGDVDILCAVTIMLHINNPSVEC